MLVTEIEDTQLVNEIQQRLDVKREGIHLSDLELCLRKSYYRRLSPQPITPKQAWMYATGLGVENYLYPQDKPVTVVDRVACSMDYAYGVEIKSTRSSMKNFNPCKPHWVFRMKGYCHAFGLTTFRLTVVFIIPADARTWIFDFTPEEIEDNWQQEVIRRRDILEQALKSGTPPVPDFHQDWECSRCELSGFCLK